MRNGIKQIILVLLLLICLGVLGCAAAAPAGQDEMSGLPMEATGMVKGKRAGDILDILMKSNEETEKGARTVATQPQQSPAAGEALKICDIYAESGQTVRLKCYYPAAESYMWEIYSTQTDSWKIPAGVDVQTDELDRILSVLSVPAKTEDIKVRCTVFMTDGKTAKDNAAIHIVPDIVAIEAEDYTADAGTYISGRDIPLLVSYADGTQDTITGLYGVSFLDRQEGREYSVNENGNTVETVTTVNTEYEYSYIDAGDKELLLRYRAGGESGDIKLTVSGKDAAPVVSATLENPEDWCETNKLIVDAADYSSVEYRFINGEEDSGWTEWNEYAISRNGTWEIQVRDAAGNVTAETVAVSNIDNQKPVINKIVIAEGDKNKDEED